MMADFYVPGSNTVMDRMNLESKFRISMTEETYIEFKFILKTARRKIGLSDNQSVCPPYPLQPLLIQIANLCTKGCSIYYRFLRKKVSLKTTLKDREDKWHQELSCTLGIDFWNSLYSRTANIKNENRIKWLQFQINRNSLYTNVKVNKFNFQVSPYCTFCRLTDSNNLNLELISHLFHGCTYVQNFWNEVKDWLLTTNINLNIDVKTILFGDMNNDINSVTNSVILYAKYFIWKSRLKNQSLLFTSFLRYLRYNIECLRDAFILENHVEKFTPWTSLYDSIIALLSE